MKIEHFKILKEPMAIVIEWQNRVLDLHNDFHFLGFYFDAEDSSFELYWKEEKWPGIKGFRLMFQNVCFLEIKPRDYGTPKSDDSCLSGLSKVDPVEKEFRHRKEWKDEPFHLLFEFEGGQNIEIGADLVDIRPQNFPLDMNRLSFEEWVQFIFDHPVAEAGWYSSDDWDCLSDEETFLTYATKLFRQPEFLLNSYMVEQLEQGLSFLASRLKDSLWNQDISWELREQCIHSMFDLSKRLFTRNLVDESCHMWWDWLRYFGDKTDERVTDAMLITLSRILTINSEQCWGSALHGLGHLQHPGKATVINQFLAEHADLDKQIRAYALAAIDDNVL